MFIMQYPIGGKAIVKLANLERTPIFIQYTSPTFIATLTKRFELVGEKVCLSEDCQGMLAKQSHILHSSTTNEQVVGISHTCNVCGRGWMKVGEDWYASRRG
jgi:hypothetical protein